MVRGPSHLLRPDSFELQTIGDGETVKIYHQAFEPPDDSSRVFSVHYYDCQSRLDAGSDYDLAENEFLKSNNLNPIDFNLILKTINNRVSHLRA